MTFFANSISRGERRGRRELIVSTLRSLRTLREIQVLLNLQKLSKTLKFKFIHHSKFGEDIVACHLKKIKIAPSAVNAKINWRYCCSLINLTMRIPMIKPINTAGARRKFKANVSAVMVSQTKI